MNMYVLIIDWENGKTESRYFIDVLEAVEWSKKTRESGLEFTIINQGEIE